MKLGNIVVGILVVVCIAFAGYRVYEFYESKIPVAEVGSCLKLKDDQGTVVKAMILKNTDDSSEMLLEFKDGKLSMAKASYRDLRGSFHAERIDCNDPI